MSETKTAPKIKQFYARLLAFCIGVLLILLVRVWVTPETPSLDVLEGSAFGTRFTVSLVSNRPEFELSRLEQTLVATLNTIDKELSTYREDSLISKFNNLNEANQSFRVSESFYKILSRAFEICVLTEGAFDVTIAPLIDLWGVGANEPKELPDNSTLLETKDFTGFDKLILLENLSIQKSDPRVKINLNAIAKGWAVDHLDELLSGLGYKNYMIEIGGEVICRGKNQKNESWRIGIDEPHPGSHPGDSIQAVAVLNNQALATSGEYRQFYKIGDQTISHTIDPGTGHPVNHNLASVSVTAETCMHADAFATALNVMGPLKGYEFANKTEGIEAYFIIQKEDQTFETKATDGFPLLEAVE